MDVRMILDQKHKPLTTCRPEDTIEAAATILTANRIGAIPVRDVEGDLAGIISERDIVRGFSEHGGKVLSLRVRDLMTRNVAVCAPTDSIKEAMRMMSRRHIRHLPVVENGALCDIISQRDVMESRLQETEMEANVLRDYAIAAGRR